MGKKIVILNGSPRKKGNTSALVKSFTEGAESAGNTVTEFFLSGMEIHGCRGCFGGHGRSSALLMAAEGNGFDDVLLYYDHLMEHLRWKNLGHVLAGGNADVGDIEGKPELKEAYELGKSIR